MKKLLSLILVLSMTVLVGCTSRVKKYTSDDALEYSKSRQLSAQMVYVRQINGDTIWTFREDNERKLKWQVFDNHYYEDSASSIETNELISNYDANVIAYYLKELGEEENFTVDYSKLDGFKYMAQFHFEISERDDIAESYEKADAFLQQAEKENSVYNDNRTDVLQAALFFEDTGSDRVYRILYGEDDDRDVAQLYLEDGLVWMDQKIIDQYDEEEVETARDAMRSDIYIRTADSDEWVKSEYVSAKGRRFIASTAFYDFLLDARIEDLHVEGDEHSFTLVYPSESYGPFEDTLISFYDAEKMSNHSFRGEWEVSEEKQNETEVPEEHTESEEKDD